MRITGLYRKYFDIFNVVVDGISEPPVFHQFG
jgi:hypothetical protein